MPKAALITCFIPKLTIQSWMMSEIVNYLLSFSFNSFVNETTMYIIFMRRFVANSSLSDEEVDRR